MQQERDPDLQAFFEAADHIGPDGVRALVDRLQAYRTAARNACVFVQDQQTASLMITNAAMLKLKIDMINNQLAAWQWQMDLDHIEASDFIND